MYFRVASSACEPAGRGPIPTIWRRCSHAFEGSNAAAGAWLETHLAPPADAFEAFEALAPAIGRLARARPLSLHRQAAGLARPAGALEVVLPAGDIEATIVPPAASDDTIGRDRARLERELVEAEGHLGAARARLGNASFTEKAPPAVVAGARRREAELSDQVALLRERLGR